MILFFILFLILIVVAVFLVFAGNDYDTFDQEATKIEPIKVSESQTIHALKYEIIVPSTREAESKFANKQLHSVNNRLIENVKTLQYLSKLEIYYTTKPKNKKRISTEHLQDFLDIRNQIEKRILGMT